jgi:glycosyltransferase involved in cell wall biosynthesis
LAGAGSLKPALERQAEDLGISVTFLEPPDEPGPLLVAADMVILPSLWETIPILLLEAMARGRPVVASAVGGIPEVVEDGWSGRLVPPGDARSLAEALESLHRRPDWASRLGSNAARRIKEDFAWARVIDGYEAVYDDVLGLASFGPVGECRIESRAQPKHVCLTAPSRLRSLA